MQPAAAISGLIAPPAPDDVPVRRLVVALAFSTVFHATILLNTELRLQPVMPASALFQVTLQPGPAKRSTGPAVEAGAHPMSAAGSPAGDASPPAAGDLISPADTGLTTAAAPPGRDDLQAIAPASPEPLAAETPDRFRLLALPPESASAADLHLMAFDIQLPTGQMPASLADLEYTVSTENQSGPTGHARYRYRVLEDGTYRLAYGEAPVQPETRDAGHEEWRGEMVGHIGPDGLQPQPDDMPAGGAAFLDSRLVGVLFQFMHLPPGLPGSSGEMRVGDTAYGYEVIQPQAMEMPSRGLLSTLQVRIQQLGLQGPAVEVWLAVDYRYLPVRIRLVDTSGNLILLRIERFTVE